ncbi:hypothetical protein J2T57_003596 [Natronocella acetinitrilica]|uniref:Uncharacterized protein n=1 Tax=Natronocella acetinitrilica TaxID=414046 RepID=A0AAE3G5S9_9GAMM|nr:hypothetical protein [Natronocella acetinitrilica]
MDIHRHAATPGQGLFAKERVILADDNAGNAALPSAGFSFFNGGQHEFVHAP